MEIKNLREIYFKDTKSEIKPLKFRNKWSLDVSLDMCIFTQKAFTDRGFPEIFHRLLDCVSWISCSTREIWKTEISCLGRHHALRLHDLSNKKNTEYSKLSAKLLGKIKMVTSFNFSDAVDFTIKHVLSIGGDRN